MKNLPLSLFAFVVLLFSAIDANAAIASVWSNTDHWFAVSNSTFDNARDAQTGDPRAELVGNALNPGFYFSYDPATNGALNPDGRLLFRVRVAAFQVNNQVPVNQPGGYGSSIFIGIDGNNDGAIDIFVVADDRGSAASNGVKLYFPSCPSGSGTCFTGPSNTNLGAQFGSNTTFTTTGVTANFNWAQVSSATDPRTGPGEAPLNNNILAGTEGANSAYRNIDGFFSFAVDFRSVKNALGSTSAPSQIANFTPSTAMKFIAITAQQTNSFNQDTGGCNNNQTVTSWACGFTAAITPSQVASAPEPGTYLTTIASLMGLAYFARRRKS